ncbi:MAG TPA: PAS domain-containing protein, partial [Allosphingosinicella sp.]|nr:PAS domain-containing protein [Allosphingosinicella sp.]
MRLEEREALSAIAQRITSVGTFIYNIAEERSTWSPELRRMVGIAEGEEALSFDQILEMAHPDDRERIRSSLDHVKVIGDRIDVEHRLYRTDGELLHMHVRGEIMEFAGQSSPCIVGTVQDITERKRAEEMIAAQAARLGEMQAEVTFLSGQSAMGTMAATLAHELNQPLTAIANYASGLRRTDLNAANARLIEEGLAAIQENAIRAGEIIRRMRAMAKQREVRKERLLFDEVVRDSTRLSGLGCDNVTIRCDLKDGDEVLADKIQIQQVLVNLIRNA